MKYHHYIPSFLLLLSSYLTLDAVNGQQPRFQTHLDAAMSKWQSYNTDKYYYEYTTTLQSADGGATERVETNFGIHTAASRVLDVFIVPDTTPTIPGLSGQEVEENFTREEVPDSLKSTAVTIERLFELIQAAITSDRNPTIQVSYDSLYGYPTAVAINYPANDDDSAIAREPKPVLAISSPSSASAAAATTTELEIVNAESMIGSIVKFVPTSFRKEQIVQYRDQWKAYEYFNYDMTYQHTVDLPPPLSSQVNIQVRDGAVSKIIEVSTGNDVTSDFLNANIKAPTMEALFDAVEATFTREFPIDIDVDYVFPYPYLRNVDIDYFDETTKEADQLNFVVSDITLYHQDRLDGARTLWQTHFADGDDNSYSFGFQKNCLCFPEFLQNPHWVTVENGAVVDATPRIVAEPTTATTEAGTSPSSFDDPAEYFPTLDAIFDKIQEAIDNNASRIAVIYDKTYGYPTKVFIDTEAMFSGDEYDIVVDGFAPVSVWQQQLEAAETMWKSQCWTSYTYVLERECYGKFCLTVQDPKVVEVVNGVVVTIDGEVLFEDSGNTNEHLPPTVEGLFLQIDEAIHDQDAFSVRATYDEAYGCPATLYIDYDEAEVDEEYSVIIRDLVGGDQDCNFQEESLPTQPREGGGEDEEGEAGEENDGESSAASIGGNGGLLYIVVVLIASSVQFMI